MTCKLIRRIVIVALSSFCFHNSAECEDKRPYLTVETKITLLSANDGSSDVVWRKTPEGLVDFDVKTKDSFTVFRLYPDKPPTSRTVYGTVPCTVIGTPGMPPFLIQVL